MMGTVTQKEYEFLRDLIRDGVRMRKHPDGGADGPWSAIGAEEDGREAMRIIKRLRYYNEKVKSNGVLRKP